MNARMIGDARMIEGAGMIYDLSVLLQSLGFRVKYTLGDTVLHAYFPHPRSGIIGASIAIGKDHFRMEILLLDKHVDFVHNCKDIGFNGIEIINCVGCMALRVRKLSGEKKPGTTCKECRDRRRIAEQQEKEEWERQHVEWKAKMEARAKADQEAALVAARKEEARAVKKAAEEEAAAQRAAARVLSDDEVLRRVAEIRTKGPASLRSIAKTLQKTHDVTETRLKKVLNK